MSANIIEFFGIVKELISNNDKMIKFKEIVSDVKELIDDIKDVIKLIKG